MNRSDIAPLGRIAPWMIGCRQLYHPLHSQIQTLIVARLSRALCIRDANLKNEILYHYCSMQSALALLQSKTFWVSNIRSMNDKFELVWLEQLARKYIESHPDHPLADWFTSGPQTFLESTIAHAPEPHAFCLSRDGDCLSQWRAYADNARGVSLGFDLKTLCESITTANENKHVTHFNNHFYELLEVEYDEGKQRAFVEGLFEQYLKESPNNTEGARLGFASELWYWGIKHKHPSFVEEKEVRLIRTTTHGSPDWTRDIDYRVTQFGL